MKTLHVNTERTWRGGEQQTLLLAAGLEARGLRSEIACQAGSPLAARARARGIVVHEIRMRGEFDLLAVKRLASILRAGEHDVVHMHTSHGHTLGVLASILARRGRRIVSRRVDFSIHRTRLKLNRFKYAHFVDRYVAISEAVRSALVADGVDPARIDVVPSGVDVLDLDRRKSAAESAGAALALRERLSLRPGTAVVGHVGHLTWHKGQEHLVDAMKILAGNGRDAALVLVGEGEERAALESRIARLGLGDAARLVGFDAEPVPYFTLFDVFVMPSVMEGLCTSVLDALALGVPVVASRAGGIPEIVSDGVNGLLVPPRDPAALAAAVERVLCDAGLGRSLVRSGRDTVARRFSADAMVEGTLRVYDGVAAPGAAR